MNETDFWIDAILGALALVGIFLIVLSIFKS